MSRPRLPHLRRIIDDLGIEVDESTYDRLARYRDLLLDWNQRVNLTAIRDSEGVEIRLLGDSLALLPLIHGASERPVRLIDVGSGAGFPGLALAIADPLLETTLVEATRKKVDFMQYVCEDLGLDNVTAIHGRAEDLARDGEHRERYDVATARAVASLPALLEICLPFLRVDGIAYFPKGQDVDEEVASASAALKQLRAEIIEQTRFHIEGLEGTTIVVVRKLAPTPGRFPRPAGTPARRPLM
jgi:16S rRNA (guanine527-N7)-methyltransferase